MPGISGVCPASKSLGQMIKEQNINNLLEEKYSFIDDFVSISHISLKCNNFKIVENDDIIAFVDGYIYNIEETNKLLSLNCENFQEQLIESYKCNSLDKLLSETDGYFNAVIYDKKIKKITLISDRLGSRFLYWYYKNSVFAFSGEVKGLLACDKIDIEIDKDILDYWTNSQVFLFGEDTLFKNIKLIKPATILEYDIKNDKISQHYYWTFKEIPQQNISYKDAVDKLYYLMENALLKRIKNIDLNNTILPLSGGLDSRLLFAILDKYNKMPKHIFTLGYQFNCLDMKISKMLCKMIKHKPILFTLDKNNFVDSKKDYPWFADGMIPIDQLSYEVHQKLPECHFLIQGYVGDAVMGGSLLKYREHLADKFVDEKIAKEIFGKNWNKSGYEDEYYNTPHIDAFIYGSRVRRFTNQMINENLHNIEPILPYIDKDLINFVYSIPDEYRLNKCLYSDMLLKYYPKYFKKIPKTPDGTTITGKIDNNIDTVKRFLNKIDNSNFLSAKWKKSFKKRSVPFKWGTNNDLNAKVFYKSVNANSLQKKYFDDNSLLKKYVTKEKFEEIKNEFSRGNTSIMTVVITIELYLRTLAEKKLI